MQLNACKAWAVANMSDASRRCNSKQLMAKAPMVKMIVYSPDRCRCVHTLQVKCMHQQKCVALATSMTYNQPETSMMAYQGPPFSGMPLL